MVVGSTRARNRMEYILVEGGSHDFSDPSYEFPTEHYTLSKGAVWKHDHGLCLHSNASLTIEIQVRLEPLKSKKVVVDIGLPDKCEDPIFEASILGDKDTDFESLILGSPSPCRWGFKSSTLGENAQRLSQEKEDKWSDRLSLELLLNDITKNVSCIRENLPHGSLGIGHINAYRPGTTVRIFLKNHSELDVFVYKVQLYKGVPPEATSSRATTTISAAASRSTVAHGDQREERGHESQAGNAGGSVATIVPPLAAPAPNPRTDPEPRESQLVPTSSRSQDDQLALDSGTPAEIPSGGAEKAPALPSLIEAGDQQVGQSNQIIDRPESDQSAGVSDLHNEQTPTLENTHPPRGESMGTPVTNRSLALAPAEASPLSPWLKRLEAVETRRLQLANKRKKREEELQEAQEEATERYKRQKKHLDDEFENEKSRCTDLIAMEEQAAKRAKERQEDAEKRLEAAKKDYDLCVERLGKDKEPRLKKLSDDVDALKEEEKLDLEKQAEVAKFLDKQLGPKFSEDGRGAGFG